jgi:hypothetical protein
MGRKNKVDGLIKLDILGKIVLAGRIPLFCAGAFGFRLEKGPIC